MIAGLFWVTHFCGKISFSTTRKSNLSGKQVALSIPFPINKPQSFFLSWIMQKSRIIHSNINPSIKPKINDMEEFYRNKCYPQFKKHENWCDTINMGSLNDFHFANAMWKWLTLKFSKKLLSAKKNSVSEEKKDMAKEISKTNCRGYWNFRKFTGSFLETQLYATIER